jgi:protein phosphatase PTC7
LATVYSGVSKHLTNPLIKKGIIGEDAFFVAAQKNCDVLGVADGVGGWASVGIDPSIFSSNLMQQCKRITEKRELIHENEANIATPVKLLEEAYYELKERKDETLIGSATACILVFDCTTNNLVSANLGDSGFVVRSLL